MENVANERVQRTVAYRMKCLIGSIVILTLLSACNEDPQQSANRIVAQLSPKTIAILDKDVLDSTYLNNDSQMIADRDNLFSALYAINNIIQDFPESNAAVSFAASQEYGGIDPSKIKSRLLFYPGGAMRLVAEEYKPLLEKSISLRSIMWFYASVLTGARNEYNVLKCVKDSTNVKRANEAIKYLIETAGRSTLMRVPWPGNQQKRTQIEHLALYFIIATKAAPRSATNQEPKWVGEEMLLQQVTANENIFGNWLKLERKAVNRSNNRVTMDANQWKAGIPSPIANLVRQCLR